MEDEETIDIVDENENIAHTVQKSTYYHSPQHFPGYLRSAELFICNSKGQLWIPRRTTNKSVAPNGLDYSCGGHLSARESYVTGIIREAAEELNLALQPGDLQFIAKLTPTGEVPYFHSIFVYNSNDVPAYNRTDFYEYYWLKPEQLLARLEAGESAKSSLLPTLRQIMAQL